MDSTTVSEHKEQELNTTTPTPEDALERPPEATETESAVKPPHSNADDVGAYVGRKTEDAVTFISRKTGEAASQAGGIAEGGVSYMGHKAEDAATYMSRKSQDASSAVGSGLRSLGATVRDRGPDEGVAGDATSAVADGLEHGGKYLQEETVSEMAGNVTNVIRRNPIQALLIGAIAGYFLGRVTTPKT